ncbi:MAG TPA: DMT family transporter [Burkholderiaceae bacterium]|nr:DMT family transporter [Burkholderiaceae bacterium]
MAFTPASGGGVAAARASASPLTTQARHRLDERHGVALMVIGGLLLGTIGVFVEEAGQDPLTTVWFRCAFGLLALLAWGAWRGRLHELRLRGTALAAALAAGVLMMVNWALFFAAIARTSIGVATVVFHVQPLWLLALGAWWLHEPLSRRQAGAVLLALLGLALATGVFGDPALGRATPARYGWGLLMCVGGSLSYAAVTLIAKLARGVSSFALAWWQCAVGALALAARPALDGWPAWGSAWAWLAGLGVLHTGLAYVVLYAGMARLSTSRIALLQFVYPATALALDWLVYGHSLGALQLTGMALMAVALLGVKRSA